MKKLIQELNTSDENKKALELFLTNTNLDKDNQVKLLEIIKSIKP